jgi:type IX secretion system PorP/SprF family membrane protein
MKRIFTLAAALGSICAFTQQDPQFSQFMHNKMFMNPGYAGMRNAVCLTAIGRQQWAGFDGAPRSIAFTADAGRAGDGGFSFKVMSDRLGFETNSLVSLGYSYHVPNIFDGTLGIGLEVGALTKRIGPTAGEQWVSTSPWSGDPVIPPQLKKSVLDAGFGLWYERKNMWFGISATHLNGKLIDDGQVTISSIVHDLKYQVARHYFITGGATVFDNGTWQIKPSFLVKSDATVTTCDVNVTALFSKSFWFGASYRYKDAICPMVGYHFKDGVINGVKVGFAYDWTTSNLRGYNNGTFEVMLNYCHPIGPKKRGGGGDDRIFDKP